MDLQGNSADIAILKSELDASYQNELTQPAFLQQRAQVQGRQRPTCAECSLVSFVKTISTSYLFVKAYLHQLGVVVLTGLVAMLACALRGKIDLLQSKEASCLPAAYIISPYGDSYSTLMKAYLYTVGILLLLLNA